MEDEIPTADPAGIAKLPALAALFAIAGIVDSVYLTIHHLTAVPVPCSMISGCETVLTSQYAEISGIPLAAVGAVAYFVAFSLAVLSAFGNRLTWTLFGAHATVMALVTCWLLYLQAFIIGAFCQFCLISAATSFALFIVFAISKLLRR